ncbi:MAG: aminotransferase class I/II-fold pyridoxal phosphate-dependent enzyme [Candidatus Sulfotelmatobacter sp.]|jgi:aspartate/methionine/tyrosine aminotransferase
MQLKPFLLDMWLAAYEHDIEFNLASSEGPRWTLNEILSLAGEEERQRFLNHTLHYSRPAGAEGLRAAIADMHDVNIDTVQVVTGASEALLILFWLAAESGANVVLPQPGYPPFSALPESLGIETRYYAVRKENDFRFDLDEIKQLVDRNTKLVLINSPHNPTGATISDTELDDLHEFTASREIQLVSDEVYHPIYHGQITRSASRLPHATVIHDFSKAFPLSGVRTGWMIEHDPKRRELYWNARTIFSISNNTAGEILAEIAMRHRNIVLGRTQETATRNLRLLASFMSEHCEMLGWIPPRGGVTAFPWLLSGENSRPFCQTAADHGILLAPGDCWDAPSHFRLGFAAIADRFPDALDQLGKFIKSWAAASVTNA